MRVVIVPDSSPVIYLSRIGVLDLRGTCISHTKGVQIEGVRSFRFACAAIGELDEHCALRLHQQQRNAADARPTRDRSETWRASPERYPKTFRGEHPIYPDRPSLGLLITAKGS
jgi:hypothetical protein